MDEMKAQWAEMKRVLQDQLKLLGPPMEMHIERICQDPIEASKIHVQRCIAELDLLLKLHNA